MGSTTLSPATPPPAYDDNGLVSRLAMFTARCLVFTFSGIAAGFARACGIQSNILPGPSPPGRPPWSIDATQVAAENAALLIDSNTPVRIASESRWQGAGNLFNLPGFLEHPDMLCVLHRNSAGWAWHSSGTSVGSHDL